MDYEVEPVELGFGKGVAISRDMRTYEQIPARDGLIVRLFKAPYERYGEIHNTDYHGIILRPSFDATNQDFQVFKDLTDRLTQASGEEIRNSKSDFMGYISHNSLEQDLERIGVSLNINRKNKEDYPESVKSWVDSVGHKGGWVADLIAYAAGFYLLSGMPSAKTTEGGSAVNISSFVNVMYGVLVPLVEYAFGLAIEGTGDFNTWCGPLHATGFIPARKYAEGKLRDPNYFLKCFMNNHHKLDAMKDVVGNQKRFAKLSKKADRSFGMIRKLFPFTTNQRGFSIHYQNPDREKVVELFSYLLEGGAVPQLTVQTEDSEKPKQEPIDVQPVQTDFINPWEIEIPKLRDLRDKK